MDYIYKVYYTIDILYRYHLHKVEKDRRIHKTDIENWMNERLDYERRINLMFDLIKENTIRYLERKKVRIDTSPYDDNNGFHRFLKMVLDKYQKVPEHFKRRGKESIHIWMIRDKEDERKYYEIGFFISIEEIVENKDNKIKLD